ncbi:MAG: hypothetical protein HOG05_01420 [Bacteroidetes bacterium]|nr:hypothetical protein [Bacteroidota bacterium]
MKKDQVEKILTELIFNQVKYSGNLSNCIQYYSDKAVKAYALNSIEEHQEFSAYFHFSMYLFAKEVGISKKSYKIGKDLGIKIFIQPDYEISDYEYEKMQSLSDKIARLRIQGY